MAERRDDFDLRQGAVVGLLVGAWIAAPAYAVLRFLAYGRAGAIGQDAHAYWLTAHQDHLYTAPPGTHDAFLYSPAFAQLVRPIAELPFGWFTAIVIAVDVVSYAWLLWPVPWRWRVPLLLMMSTGFVLGNVIGIVTVGAVLAVTGRSGWWAAGYLTKIAPGLVGVPWHAARGEWRLLGVSWAWTGGLVAVSFAIWPGAWHDWFRFLRSSDDPAATARLVAGLVLVAVGGWRRWWWVVPVALVVVAPVYGQGTVGYLAGLIRLHGQRREIGRRATSTG